MCSSDLPHFIALDQRASLDRFFQQLGIELEADSRDLARLVPPQQVAGTPQLQVMGGDPEACPQLGDILEDFQPLP